MFIEDIGDIEIRPSKRAKHLKLAVSARSGVYVVKPTGISERMVKRFVFANKVWLKKRLSKMPTKLSLKDSEKFSQIKTLKVITSSGATKVLVKETDNELLLTLPTDVELHDKSAQDTLMKNAIKIWRREAKIYLPRRLDILAKKHEISYGNVRAKYMHTRWGSCSSTNNINLNIQLMRLESELIDHVLLHELAHTKEHNHSKAFWSLFESLETDARGTSKLLKLHQLF